MDGIRLKRLRGVAEKNLGGFLVDAIQSCIFLFALYGTDTDDHLTAEPVFTVSDETLTLLKEKSRMLSTKSRSCQGFNQRLLFAASEHFRPQEDRLNTVQSAAKSRNSLDCETKGEVLPWIRFLFQII
jgi:hypothetical protein